MNTKITICVGLNDKETKNQKITTTAANDLIYNAVVKYFGFGTVSNCAGVYSHDDGSNTTVCETSVKIELTFFKTGKKRAIKKCLPFVQEMKRELNQESIYLEATKVCASLI